MLPFSFGLEARWNASREVIECLDTIVANLGMLPGPDPDLELRPRENIEALIQDSTSLNYSRHLDFHLGPTRRRIVRLRKLAILWSRVHRRYIRYCTWPDGMRCAGNFVDTATHWHRFRPCGKWMRFLCASCDQHCRDIHFSECDVDMMNRPTGLTGQVLLQICSHSLPASWYRGFESTYFVRYSRGSRKRHGHGSYHSSTILLQTKGGCQCYVGSASTCPGKK